MTKPFKIETRAAAPDDADVSAALAELTRTTEARLAEVAELRASLEEMRAEVAESRAATLIGGGGGSAPAMGETRALARFADMLRGRVESRDMNGVVGPAGGFAVPLEIDSIVTSIVADLSPIRGVAQVVQTSTSNYRRLINQRGAASGWAAERDERMETATPNLAAIEPPSGELYALAVTTNEVLEDAAFDARAFLSQNVATEFAAAEGLAFVSGDGMKKPRGVLAYPTAATRDDVRPFGTLEHVGTGDAAGLPSDDPADPLHDLVTALRPGYRIGAGVAWAMNSKTAGMIRSLKDADGRYMWQSSLAAGQPNTLLGYPVVEVEGMPDFAPGATPIAFGNWRAGYLITDRRGVVVIPDNITRPGFTKFYFSKRTGGSVLDSNAIKLLRVEA